jgi:hypothetical protein
MHLFDMKLGNRGVYLNHECNDKWRGKWDEVGDLGLSDAGVDTMRCVLFTHFDSLCSLLAPFQFYMAQRLGYWTS